MICTFCVQPKQGDKSIQSVIHTGWRRRWALVLSRITELSCTGNKPFSKVSCRHISQSPRQGACCFRCISHGVLRPPSGTWDTNTELKTLLRNTLCPPYNCLSSQLWFVHHMPHRKIKSCCIRRCGRWPVTHYCLLQSGSIYRFSVESGWKIENRRESYSVWEWWELAWGCFPPWDSVSLVTVHVCKGFAKACLTSPVQGKNFAFWRVSHSVGNCQGTVYHDPRQP